MTRQPATCINSVFISPSDISLTNSSFALSATYQLSTLIMDMQPRRDVRLSIDSLEVRHPPPPGKPRTVWTWDMFRHRTPTNIIEELRSITIVDGNFTKFQKRLDELTSSSEEEFNIHDLGNAVMSVAVSRDCTPFVSELLRRGVPMDKSYVLDAIKGRATGSLELFLWNGFDVNAPTTEVDPPVLG